MWESVLYNNKSKEQNNENKSKKVLNAEAFIEECRKRDTDENKLLQLVEDGIDINHTYYTGKRNGWDGDVYRLLSYAVRLNSAKLMEKLLEVKGVESEFCNHNYQEYRGSSPAWVRHIFDDLYTYGNCDNALAPLLKRIPEYCDVLLDQGFKHLSDEVAAKMLNDDSLGKEKINALVKARSFAINSEILPSLHKLNSAKSLTILIDDLSPKERLFLTDTLKGFEKLSHVKIMGQVGGLEDARVLAKGLAKVENLETVYCCEEHSEFVSLRHLVDEEREKAKEEEHKDKPEWQVSFYKALATKDAKAALNILIANSCFDVRKQTTEAEFGREHPYNGALSIWGQSKMKIHDALEGLQIVDLGDNLIAVGQIYENRSWRSCFDHNQGIAWNWQGELSVVNIHSGLGAKAKTNTICVRDAKNPAKDIFQHIDKKEFLSVDEKNKIVRLNLGGYASALITLPDTWQGAESKSIQDIKTIALNNRLVDRERG